MTIENSEPNEDESANQTAASIKHHIESYHSSDSDSESDSSEEKVFEMLTSDLNKNDKDGDTQNENILTIGAITESQPNEILSDSLMTEKILNASNLISDNKNRNINIQIANSRATSTNSNQKMDSSTSLFRRSSTNNIHGKDAKVITVSWRNLMYKVERKQLDIGNCFGSENGRSMVRLNKRTILKGICGQFCTGHLTAVMGPSGSGKSTLLECIVGFRKKGLSGDIRVTSNSGQNVKVALIAQTDYLIESFTVREMLVYASRLKNYKKEVAEEEEPPLEEVVTISESVNNLNNVDSNSKGNLLAPKKVKNYHHRLVINVIEQLGLNVCADTRAGNCSGGQKKRISIALEMISKPNILILDEPTSGLDSSACYQTVSVMQRLTRNDRHPVAVVATIHQPSARVFNLFDHIYIISYNGHCIYQGSPQNMLAHLASVDLICPQFHNPADYIAEVASGEHGAESVERLIEAKHLEDSRLLEIAGSDRTLAQYSEMNSYPFLLHVWILVQRTTLHIVRDPMLNSLRLMSHLLTALFIGLLYGPSIGKPALCPPLISPLNDLENFPSYRIQFQNDTVTSTENLAFVFFTLMFVMFGSMMPTIMTFPANLNNLRKEKINGWYSVATYYIALSIAEIPFQLLYPTVFVSISYLMTGQVLSVERFLLFLLICVLMAFVSQSQGLLIGAFFMSDASAAVFLGPISTVPIMLFGGFFVRIATIPEYLRPFSHLSFMKYAFEAMVTVLYGFDRCHIEPEQLNTNNTNKPEWMDYAVMILGEGGEKFIDSFARSLGGTYDPTTGKKYQSTILNQYDVSEDKFAYNISMLAIFFLTTRIITYFVLSIKINKRD